MFDILKEFLRSPLGKRVVAILLATLGISVTFNEVSESVNRVNSALESANHRSQFVMQRE